MPDPLFPCPPQCVHCGVALHATPTAAVIGWGTCAPCLATQQTTREAWHAAIVASQTPSPVKRRWWQRLWGGRTEHER